MKTSDILRQAKVNLSHYECQGVCSAIIKVPYTPVRKINAVLTDIRDRLYPYSYITQWLSHKMTGIKYAETLADEIAISNWRDQFTRADFQAYRHRWLDQLIQEYQAKGD